MSEVPISNERYSKIDTNVVGAWANFTDKGKLEMAIKINALDNHKYIFNLVNFTEEGERLAMFENYIAYSSTINNQIYINTRALDNKKKERYFFYKYLIKEDTLFTYAIFEKQFKQKFTSAKKFRKYIKNNEDDFNKKFREHQRFIRIHPSPK